MRIYLSANEYTKEQAEEATAVRTALKTQGYTVTPDPLGCDLVVSLGGDGAMLKAAKIALAAGRPLMGVNSGRLGYLCALKLQNIEAFTEVLSNAVVSERTVLETETGGNRIYALNDIIFGKRVFGQTVEIGVRADGRELMSFIGDGLIVSTPTGSTAYSRHAGGPVIAAGVDAVCLTPICADVRPHIVSGKSSLEVVLKRGDFDVYADGVKLDFAKSSMSIRRSGKVLRLIMPGE